MHLQSISDTKESDDRARNQALTIIAKLSTSMIGVMKSHAEGPQPFYAGNGYAHTIHALRDRGLLSASLHKTRPKTTAATGLGRRVIALMLASEADALSERMERA